MYSQVWHKDLESQRRWSNHLFCYFFFILMQSADGDAQTLTEVDLFISTQRIKVLNADSQVRDSKHTYIMFLFFTRECYSHRREWKLFTLPVPQPPTEVLHIRGVLLCHSWHNCSLTVGTYCLLWNAITDCSLFICLFNLLMSLSDFFWTRGEIKLCQA